jgi:hypothetical protein
MFAPPGLNEASYPERLGRMEGCVRYRLGPCGLVISGENTIGVNLGSRCSARANDEDRYENGHFSRGSLVWLETQKLGHRAKGLELPKNGGRPVLPNVLPLPRKSSPKQDEPRATRVSYVIEIQGTA